LYLQISLLAVIIKPTQTVLQQNQQISYTIAGSLMDWNILWNTQWELLRADVIADPNSLLRELDPLDGWISDGVEIFVAPGAETLKQWPTYVYLRSTFNHWKIEYRANFWV